MIINYFGINIVEASCYEDLKQQIINKYSSNANLYSNGSLIYNDETLQSTNYIDLNICCVGGKKRKKKVKSTPKRKPHKHRLEKLTVLKH
jgi:hypothetical protein